VGRAKDALISGIVLLLRRRKPRPLGPGERERVVPPAPDNPGWELTAVLLLLAGAACAIAFVVVYVLDRLPAHTQLLGLSLGLSLLFIAAALIVTAHRLIVAEELEDDYPVLEHPEEQELIVQVVEDSGLTRRRLLKLALLTAGGALTAAVLTPIASLGPAVDLVRFYATPWRRGTRLVDEHGKPYKASDIEEDNFYTAFAEGSDKEALPSSLVLVRLPKGSLKLPRELADYAAEGIVAYSKICTHAGCAISLYRAPLFQPDEPTPALVCPCHYSTFNPADGGTVTFGPAGRKLPMLPLLVAPNGELRAAGNFDQPVGPSWWGVRERKPRT
jgi:ubiquinol-cytochrome c reductase iron-sulfur subunit